ncbi:MAG: HEAT repeat domain-containing protein [Pseudomonadota bacterium]|nr:HEAT repeat domain-containing protein [Pseudomonadota bacterium]
MTLILIAVLGAALAGTPGDVQLPAASGALAAAGTAALATPDARALSLAPVSDATLSALVESAGWRLRARAAAALEWRQDPTFADAVATCAPLTTRNGAIRFTDRRLRAPEAAPLLVERLVSSETPSAERAALVDALRLSGGDWSEAVAGLLAVESDPAVREQLAGALEHAEADVARAGLALAASDTAGSVRAAALRAIGAREDGGSYAAVVFAALGDTDPAVRAYAARAAGWLGLTGAWSAVVSLLADSDADVRLRAVAALERLGAEEAAALPGLRALTQDPTRDPDPRVARAALRVIGR